jgi:ribosomal protein S18 acetylase RimI-like enzyme
LLEKAAAEVAIDVVRPFRAIPGKAGAEVGFDYALPVDRLDATLPDAVGRLKSLYRARREPLRLEFNEQIWPALGPALESAGLLLERRNPLMACRRDGFVPFGATSVAVEFLDVDPRHRSTRRGVGRLGGAMAGWASLGSIDGVAELYAVITDPAFRRRGVAATLCSALIQRHFDDGGKLVFLDAENGGAQALYARLGFETVGDRLTYAEPD